MILMNLLLTMLHSCICYAGHTVPLLAPTAINAIYLLTTDSKLSSSQIPGHTETVAQALLTTDLIVTNLTHLCHNAALIAINLVLCCCLANTPTTEGITVHQEDLDKFFLRVQTLPHARSVPSALVTSPTESNSASQLNCGTREQC